MEAPEEEVLEENGIARVIHFYETHPINEEQIRAKLATKGVALDGLSEDVLKDYDQDHFGGLLAVEELALGAGIDGSTRVLDVCSGIGGPARYLASRLGCRVTGLDITASRHESAVRLTHLVGLDRLVDFQLGNALDMPFEDGSFDVVIGEEAFCHVPDKPRLIRECARVVKPGGRLAFTDILKCEGLGAEVAARLCREMTFQSLESLDGYRTLLEGNGCCVIRADDLGRAWTRILEDRLQMYRSLEDTTTARFGAAHFRRWDDTYAFFVGLFATGGLTGGRFVARKDRPA